MLLKQKIKRQKNLTDICGALKGCRDVWDDHRLDCIKLSLAHTVSCYSHRHIIASSLERAAACTWKPLDECTLSILCAAAATAVAMAAGVLAAGSAYFAPLTSLQCLWSCIEVACQQNTFQAHLCSPPHGCASRHAAANSAFSVLMHIYVFLFIFCCWKLPCLRSCAGSNHPLVCVAPYCCSLTDDPTAA